MTGGVGEMMADDARIGPARAPQAWGYPGRSPCRIRRPAPRAASISGATAKNDRRALVDLKQRMERLSMATAG